MPTNTTDANAAAEGIMTSPLSAVLRDGSAGHQAARTWGGARR